MMYTVYISTGTVFQIMNALITARGDHEELISIHWLSVY